MTSKEISQSAIKSRHEGERQRAYEPASMRPACEILKRYKVINIIYLQIEYKVNYRNT